MGKFGKILISGLVVAAIAAGGTTFYLYKNGKLFADQGVDASCEHVWTDGETTIEATCTKAGEKTYTCTVCGDTKTETLAAVGHSWDEGEVTIEATCEKAGEKTYTCTVCGDTKTETIAAVGHSWNEGEITLEGSCTEPSEKTYTCIVCGATKTETIENLAHSWDNGVVTRADCYNYAKVTYTCTECGDTKEEVAGLLVDYGNAYQESTSSSKKRISIYPFLIAIEEGTTLTAIDGYQMMIYRCPCEEDEGDPTNTECIISWTTSYTFEDCSYYYGITIKKTDGTEFDFDTESMLASDYIESSDPSIWTVEKYYKHSGEVTTEENLLETDCDQGSDGSVTYYYCSDCGELIYEERIEPVGHNYVNGVCQNCWATDPDYEGEYIFP